MAQLGIRAAGPFGLVVGAYLLFAGHNRPGGGFAAGLVFGAVLTLRSVAGFPRTTHGFGLVAAGITVVVATAAAPVFWNNPLLDQAVWSTDLPLFGTVKSGTALVFDIGVAAIVVGLVIALLDGLATEDPELDEPTPDGDAPPNPSPSDVAPKPREEIR
ncbi:MnhB domain-containing protein [Candidatus Poriferisocius sp.]|uniref:MnhB domain-containing protein n=1 Tax=Candidatus Poriferisocius sp. TaxID=3101276 RepID=UPI003B5C3C19